MRAVPIGTMLPLESGGDLAEAGLLALVLAPDRAVLTATAWPSEPAPGAGRPGRRPPAQLRFGGLIATDEHGTQYRAGPTAQSAGNRLSVTFELTPVPPPGTRRLDITGPGVKEPTPIGLIRRPGSGPDPADSDSSRLDPYPGRPHPAHRGGRHDSLTPAERPLDALAERLLADLARGYGPGDAPLSGLAEVAGALRAVAGLTAGSAALSRLATLAGRLGIDFPAGLRPLTRPAELPDAWASVLDHRGAADGPDGVAAVAAVLPEVDGARFALAGLDSVADSATLRVVAWGWQPSPRPGLGGDRFSWWARDDRGRWHLAREHGVRYGGGQVDLLVEFGPALDPDARALEIIVRGPSSQSRVTVPLHWLVPR